MGYAITDLPLRQCYYFGTDPINGHSLLLASYNDMRTVAFWQALESGERFHGKEELQNSSFSVSRVMVEEAMLQLREMHGSSIEIPSLTWLRTKTGRATPTVVATTLGKQIARSGRSCHSCAT